MATTITLTLDNEQQKAVLEALDRYAAELGIQKRSAADERTAELVGGLFDLILDARQNPKHGKAQPGEEPGILAALVLPPT